MAAPGAPRLLLFVAGEPRTVPSLRESGAGLYSRLVGTALGSGAVPRGPSSPPTAGGSEPLPSEGSNPREGPEWYLPPDQMSSLNLVHQVAQRRHCEVLVVDVNRAGNQQALVDQYVRPNDVLPLLVRWDGARLDGGENFTPVKLRQFVRAP